MSDYIAHIDDILISGAKRDMIAVTNKIKREVL